MTVIRNQYKDILFGVAIGDALGVPFEFKSRSFISKQPAVDMIGYGTHNLPAGYFSDDSSLTFCLAEALTKGFDLQLIADNFAAWLNKNYWTPGGSVFDVGIATSKAIRRIELGCPPELAGGMDESDNGNGSLMRILPLVLYLRDKEISVRFEITKQVSSITHGHIRSVIACFYYLEFARLIIDKADKFQAYNSLKKQLTDFLHSNQINQEEIKLFNRLLKDNIHELSSTEIFSSGYVVHTLEASIWCILTTNSYREATLKAVNLGEDTDTTAAVTGGLAGLLYGYATIPKEWMDQLARSSDITDLADRIQKVLES